jgi:ADP-ribosylglycohydrolase
MLGAIAGDIIGSVFERRPVKTVDFALFVPRSRFTDDTVLTVATADCILSGGDYARLYRDYGRRYPDAGYGGAFKVWVSSDSAGPYGSFGNGSAMRVSPVGYAFQTIEEVNEEAGRSARVTHNHPEGVKGAQATAAAVFLARGGKGKREIREYIERAFSYDLGRTIEEIRPGYHFDVTCQGTVPEALTAFLDSADFEDAVRKAVSLGGDSDTLACITGGVAEAFYGGVPAGIEKEVRKRLAPGLLDVVDRFRRRFGMESRA